MNDLIGGFITNKDIVNWNPWGLAFLRFLLVAQKLVVDAAMSFTSIWTSNGSHAAQLSTYYLHLPSQHRLQVSASRCLRPRHKTSTTTYHSTSSTTHANYSKINTELPFAAHRAYCICGRAHIKSHSPSTKYIFMTPSYITPTQGPRMMRLKTMFQCWIRVGSDH